MSNEILDNGTIKLDEGSGNNDIGDRILHPCYWDEDTDAWKNYDFGNNPDLSADDKTWINNNFTDAHKNTFKQIFGAGKE
jgi:hypothetical protein